VTTPPLSLADFRENTEKPKEGMQAIWKVF